jgi:hypothetical protein
MTQYTSLPNISTVFHMFDIIVPRFFITISTKEGHLKKYEVEGK